MTKKEVIKKLNWMENVAWRCIVAEHLFQKLSNRDELLWTFIQNMLEEYVCINWRHLFGNNKDDIHFRNFFDGSDIPNLGKILESDYVKQRILEKINMSNRDYEFFWKIISELIKRINKEKLKL